MPPRRPERDDVARLVPIDLEIDERPRRDERPARPDGVGPAVERQRPVRIEPGVRPDRPERDLGRHLVGAADDRQPIAAGQEPVPLADRRPVDAGRQRLHLDRVDPPAHDIGGDLRIGQREMDRDGQPALGVGRVGPVGA